MRSLIVAATDSRRQPRGLRPKGCGRKLRAVKRVTAFVAATALLVASPANAAIGSAIAAPPLYKNCTNLNKKYPHGLGRMGARDQTSGTPVTNFKRSTKLYKLAMSYNRGLDRDKDGVACEKA
jgi:hypothetical protein